MSTSNQQITIDKNKRIVVPFKLNGAQDITEGTLYSVTKTESELILSPIGQNAPYRIYSADELNQFIEDDRLNS